MNSESNKTQMRCNLKGVKSKFIIEEIFNNLCKKKFLKIIKYDKKIQNKLDIKQNDFKIFTDIEIEIIPVNYKYGEFIKMENKEYYSIYFNDSEEEIKK